MLTEIGFEATSESNPDEFREAILSDVVHWRPIVTALNLKDRLNVGKMFHRARSANPAWSTTGLGHKQTVPIRATWSVSPPEADVSAWRRGGPGRANSGSRRPHLLVGRAARSALRSCERPGCFVDRELANRVSFENWPNNLIPPRRRPSVAPIVHFMVCLYMSFRCNGLIRRTSR